MSNTQEKLGQVQEQVASAVEQAKEAAQSAASKVSDFFQGNPFETPVGRKIEQATDATALATENWGLNMEICDFINSTNEGGRDAVRAIRKRLQAQIGKNNAIVMYTLTVLETCVKNCDQRFKALVCQKEFVNDLVKLMGPKFDAPQIVQERILSLIQSWADAFRGNPALNGVCEVYDELKNKGVEFPATDFETMAPILTPKRTVYPPGQPAAQPAPVPVQQEAPVHPAPVQPVQQTDVPFVPVSGPTAASPEQLAKLRSELDVVNSNIAVLRDLLSGLTPGQETPDEYHLLEQLYETCKAMQSRVMELIPVITNEEVTYELLFVNDEFNSTFEKYQRYMGNRNSRGETSAASASSGNLIDLGTSAAAPLSQQLESLEIHDGSQGKQSAKSEEYVHDQTDAGLHKAAFDKTAPISEREAQEMSQWLETQGEGASKAAEPKKEPKKEDDGL